MRPSARLGLIARLAAPWNTEYLNLLSQLIGGDVKIVGKTPTGITHIDEKGERKAPGEWLTYVNTAKKSQPGNNGNRADKGNTVSAPAKAADEPVLKYQTAASIPD